jgi:hypothetical protein
VRVEVGVAAAAGVQGLNRRDLGGEDGVGLGVSLAVGNQFWCVYMSLRGGEGGEGVYILVLELSWTVLELSRLAN